MTVSYNSKKVIPAPFVSVTKTYQTSGDGNKVGSVYAITITGSLVAYKGSPDSSKVFWTIGGYPPDEVLTSDENLGALLRKQEAIRELFSQDGLSLEWQSADGSSPMKCNPRIQSITFQEGQWYNTVQYTIAAEADIVYVNGAALGEDSFSEYISSASESWSIETDETPEGPDLPRTYRLSHSVNATGKRFFEGGGTLLREAWRNAQAWVLPRLGFDSTIALSSGVNNLSSYYSGWNHARSESIGENDGTYSVTETFILASGSALEDFTVSTRNSINDGLVAVEINGQITGLEERDSNLQLITSKYDNALTKYNEVELLLHNRAQSYSGYTLNAFEVNSTVGQNPNTGSISYGFEFNNRPTNLITDSLSESIQLNDGFGADLFASIAVLGRSAGPVLQSLSSKQAVTRDLSLEIVFGAAFVGSGNVTSRMITNHPRNKSPQAAEIQSIVSAVHPVNAGMLNNNSVQATVAYVNNQRESWDGIAGRYSLQIGWTLE